LLSGDTVILDATGEVRNGGTITAQNSLTAIAGRDLNVVSTTQSSAGNAGNYSFAQSGVDRLAGLYLKGPGVLLASAGTWVG
jgi:filamentous hemagglutinin